MTAVSQEAANWPWVPCAADHPDAIPDLNRLARECRWDAGQARWVLPS